MANGKLAGLKSTLRPTTNDQATLKDTKVISVVGLHGVDQAVSIELPSDHYIVRYLEQIMSTASFVESQQVRAPELAVAADNTAPSSFLRDVVDASFSLDGVRRRQYQSNYYGHDHQHAESYRSYRKRYDGANGSSSFVPHMEKSDARPSSPVIVDDVQESLPQSPPTLCRPTQFYRV